MATNSIIDNLNSKDIISTIKLEMGADIKREKVFCAVEGIDDVKFCRFFVKKNVIICESYSGKKGIEDIINFFKGNKNVIAIRDKDYESRTLDERIFYYDFCCLEIMIVADDDVFERLCCEYYRGEKEFLEIRNEILHALSKISLMRKKNELMGKMWNFNSLTYSDVVTGNSIIDDSKIDEKILAIGNYTNIDELLTEIGYRKEYTETDLLNITNGHDFIKMFCEYCKKSTGRNKSVSSISESLRCSFNKEKFQHTKLFLALKEYQENNNLLVI